MAFVIAFTALFLGIGIKCHKRITGRSDQIWACIMMMLLIGMGAGALISLIVGACLPDNNIAELKNEHYLVAHDSENKHCYRQIEKDGDIIEVFVKENNKDNILVQEWQIKRNNNTWIDITGNTLGPSEYKIFILEEKVIR